MQSEHSIINYKLQITLSSGDSDGYQELLEWCQVSLNSMAHMNEIVDSRADIEEEEVDGQTSSKELNIKVIFIVKLFRGHPTAIFL